MPGFGSKTQWTELAKEITTRMTSNSRPNVQEWWMQNRVLINDFQKEVSILTEKLRIRTPKFRYITFTDEVEE